MANLTPILPKRAKLTEENKKDFNKLRTCLCELKLKLEQGNLTLTEEKEVIKEIEKVKREIGKLYLLSNDNEIYNKLGGIKK